jgi:hypothetical protein
MNRLPLVVLAIVLGGCTGNGQGSPSVTGTPGASQGATPAASSPLESATAAPDFGHPAQCSDTHIGYTLTYPGNWSTNTATAETPACRAFSTVGQFEVPMEIPEYVRIWVLLQDTPPSSEAPPGMLSRETVLVDGREAVRQEVALDDAGGAQLTYIVPVEELGFWFISATSTEHLGDYDTNKEVLDWLMASATFQ